MNRIAITALLCGLSMPSMSGPYIPQHEAQIIVSIHQGKQLRQLNILRQQLNSRPNNLDLLEQIIQRYIQLGRAQDNERYFSYAQSLLQPYLEKLPRQSRLWLDWADILQRQHRFKEALAVLDTITAQDVTMPRANLMRAVIRQVRGEYKAAMQDCRALLGRVDLLVATTCITQIQGLQGQLPASVQLLQQTLERYRTADAPTLRWSRTVLAEMSIRLGRPQQAYQQLRRVSETAYDSHALAMMADVLITQQRYDEVRQMLQAHRQVDKLLLRYVIASKRSGQVAERDLDALHSVVRRMQMTGAHAHGRMLARYYLDVADDPHRALQSARYNWTEQREPDDALILLRCLHALGDSAELQSIHNSLSNAGVFDVRRENLLVGGRV